MDVRPICLRGKIKEWRGGLERDCIILLSNISSLNGLMDNSISWLLIALLSRKALYNENVDSSGLTVTDHLVRMDDST